MIKTLRFDRAGVRFAVPEVTVSFNNGWDLKEAGHRAIVEFDGLRINGATLTDEKEKKALRAVVFAAAAYSDAGEEYDKLVRSETEKGNTLIFSKDQDERSNLSYRRNLEQTTSRLELMLAIASDLFLSVFQGRLPTDETFSRLGALAESFLGDDAKRDVLVL